MRSGKDDESSVKCVILCKVKLPRNFCHLIVYIFHIADEVASDNYIYDVCATCSVNAFFRLK